MGLGDYLIQATKNPTIARKSPSPAVASVTNLLDHVKIVFILGFWLSLPNATIRLGFFRKLQDGSIGLALVWRQIIRTKSVVFVILKGGQFC